MTIDRIYPLSTVACVYLLCSMHRARLAIDVAASRRSVNEKTDFHIMFPVRKFQDATSDPRKHQSIVRSFVHKCAIDIQSYPRTVE
jgi:hypothetical protein